MFLSFLLFVNIVIFLLISRTLSISFECPPCPPFSDNPYIWPNCKYTYIDKCGCTSHYTKELGQPCGGYLNYWGTCTPGLTCVYRLGGVLNEERHGFCETEYCSIQTCGYRQRCVNRRRHERGHLCICHPLPAHCTEPNTTTSNSKVCGNDGRTYKNMCRLQRAECRSGSVIGIMSTGGSCSEKDHREEEEEQVNEESVSLSYKPNYCLYEQREYSVGDIITINEDLCQVVSCVGFGNSTVLSLSIPGCGRNTDDFW